MSGVLFIVVVPTKEYEEGLKVMEKAEETEKHYDNLGVVDEKGTHRGKLGKSCASVNKDDQPSSLYKSKSESILIGSDSALSIFKKHTWDELKQITRRKNKVKISSPLRGDDILDAFHSDTALETILSEILKRLGISNAAWATTRQGDFWQVTFSLESTHICEETLQVLGTFGIGARHQSVVSVIPCTLFFQDSSKGRCTSIGAHDLPAQYTTETAWTRFASSVRSRTNLAQILHDVRNEAAFTFDWLFLLIVAAFVAAIGLIENSTVFLVASMLISPLMGPITAGTLGTAVRDHSLQAIGVTNELLGLFFASVIGFLCGLIISVGDFGEQDSVEDWPTYEMMSRCDIRSLWVGVLIAIPSGAGVALTVLGEYTASLVGVAISASLLPPAVNAGLLWAMALAQLAFQVTGLWPSPINSTTYSTNPAVELAVLGTLSFCLTLVNIICIFLAGIAVYKVKEVSALDKRDITWWRTRKSFLQSSKRNHSYTPTSWKHPNQNEIPPESPSAFQFQTPTVCEEQDGRQINNINEFNSVENSVCTKHFQANHLDKRRRGFLYETDDVTKEIHKVNNQEQNKPVIEPSLSYTIDKNCLGNPILADKSFAV